MFADEQAAAAHETGKARDRLTQAASVWLASKSCGMALTTCRCVCVCTTATTVYFVCMCVLARVACRGLVPRYYR